MTFDEILGKFTIIKKTQNGRMAICPVHGDEHASLHISEGSKGVLIYCHAGCNLVNILEMVGLYPSDLFYDSKDASYSSTVREDVKTRSAAQAIALQPKLKSKVKPAVLEAKYDYEDPQGRLVYQVLRYSPKSFKQRCPGPNGEWIWSMDGVKRYLYKTPEILRSTIDTTVWLVEGEKDANALWDIGLLGTTIAGGANAWKQHSETYIETLTGRDVVIIPDNDKAGRAFANEAASSLYGKAQSVYILELPGLDNKQDLSDWLAIENNDAERLCQLAENLSGYQPSVADDPRDAVLPQVPPLDSLGVPQPANNWRRTHEGMAYEFLSRVNPNLKWVNDLNPDLKSDAGWASYNEKTGLWQFGPTAITYISEVQRRMTAEYREMAREMLSLVNGQRAALTHEEKSALDFSQTIESSQFKSGWKSEIKTHGDIHMTIQAFDSQHWLLTVKNGVIDLRTGELLPFSRNYYSSKKSNIQYDPYARCPRWEQFLGEIFEENVDLIKYIQRAIGYSLTGETSEQCLFLCHGAGANGKSVMLDILIQLLGEFAADTPMSTFSVKNQPQVGNDLAMLRGTRLVVASETNQGTRLDEALVKKATGQDLITARRLYQDFFSYMPTFKLWLAMNHKPTIRGIDNGIWRRIRMIPFNVVFHEDRQDRKLKSKLLTELPGILNWAIEGCRDWQQNGMQTPTIVQEATAEYREEQDVLGLFIQEKCMVGDYEIPASMLYSAYKAWADEGGEFTLSQTLFGRQLTERGFPSTRTSRGKMRIGISLLSRY